ncbi:MFS transporter [Paenibacillus hodogayensis]|uniref:MFS transporter n=1 Tax=Paenibacillus hodogayensis TaxID=279208 RepID=A0ABV5W2N8_9BACL
MFRNRYVRTIMMSRMLLQLGVWVRNFAILLYVTDLTNNDPLYVSLISVAEFAPIFVFAIIGGTFADRWPPKRTMVWCDMLSALSVLVVLLVVLSGSWHALLFATLVSSILSQFSQPSGMKLFKQHVPAEQLQGVMAMFQTLVAVFTVIGPILGTFLYQRYGIELSIALMVVMFVGSGFVLSRLPRDAEPERAAADRSFKREMLAGLRYVRESRVLTTLGAIFAIMGIAVGMIQPLGLYVAIEKLSRDKTFLQWLLTVNGAAMLVGGAFIVGLAKKVSPQALLATGLIVSSVGTAGIGWSSSLALTLLLQVLTGLFYPTVHAGINTMMLKNTESSFVGRVGGALSPIFTGTMVVGMSFAGLLKEALSLSGVYTLSGALFMIGAFSLILIIRGRSASVGGRSGAA